MAILGITAGIPIPNATGFVSNTEYGAKVSEGYQVKLAVTCYQAEGNTITEAFTVGPYDKGVLDSYLMGELAHSWTIGINGSLSESGSYPDPDPEPDPEPEPVILIKSIQPLRKIS